MEALKWLWTYLKPFKWRYGLGLLGVLMATMLSMVNPILGGKIVDDVLEGGQTEKLIFFVVMMIVVAIVKDAIDYSYKLNFEVISQRILVQIRENLYDKLLELDVDFYKKTMTGDIMARVTGDTDALRHFIAWVVYNAIFNISSFIFALITMWFISPELTLSMLVICPIIAFFTLKMSGKIGPTFHLVREAYSRLNSVVQENISGNRVVKAFSNEAYEIEKFQKENLGYKKANMETIKVTKAYLPVLEFLANTLTVLMLLVGGLLVIGGQMSIGDLMIFNGLLWALNGPMRSAGYLINDTQRFIASTAKIRELLETKSKIQNTENAVTTGEIKGDIEFQNVSFSFEDTDALKKVSFKAKAGQTIGIVGHTGAGKSTLINLICRFYEPVSGRILIDGKDIKSYELNSLRSHIAMAMQDVFLFSDTIWANIAFGVPKASLDQISRVAAIAEADHFIRSMPEGYDTIVGERGVGLSGGQRQRIALARALIKDPSILILDDTTSALDMETEVKIQKEVNEKLKKRTTFIIAHRISSVKHADLILVLEHGKVVEQGTHEQLMALQGRYEKVYQTQFGDFDEMKEAK